MDHDLMTDEELAERDLVLITCTGCGETYGYAIEPPLVAAVDREELARELAEILSGEVTNRSVMVYGPVADALLAKWRVSRR